MSPSGGHAGDRSIRVVLAASDPALSALLAECLEGDGLFVSAVEASASEAITAVSAHEPDVFVVATDLVGSALIAAARIAARTPVTKVLVVARAPDDDDCLTYLMVGAAGYISAATDCASLAPAVRQVAAGRAIVPPGAQRRLLDELRTQLV